MVFNDRIRTYRNQYHDRQLTVLCLLSTGTLFLLSRIQSNIPISFSIPDFIKPSLESVHGSWISAIRWFEGKFSSSTGIAADHHYTDRTSSSESQYAAWFESSIN